MKETLLLTADWHFTENQKDSYRWSLFPYLEDMINDYNVDRLIVLGDLTEEKDRHPSSLVNRIVDGIDNLSQSCKVDILMGNHDGTDLENPYFKFLHKMKNVRFITKPLNDNTYLFLPYSNSISKELFSHDVNYVFMHQLFAGAEFANHFVSDQGLNTDDLHFMSSVKIYSGDIHLPQVVQGVTYIGSPYSIDFGDHFDGRILLLKDDKEISLQPGFLKKWSITIEDVKDLNTFEFGEADQLSVKFTLRPLDFHRVDDLRKQVREYCINKKLDLCSLEMKPLKVQKRLRINASKEEVKQMSSADIVSQFSKKESLSSKQLEIGLELVR